MEFRNFHNTFRELIFCGSTNKELDSVPVPLMCHYIKFNGALLFFVGWRLFSDISDILHQYCNAP